MFRLLFFLLWLLPLCGQPRRIAPVSSGGRRVAMVVGNGSYRSIASLDNPVRDAQAMKSALEECGFAVIYAANATREALEEAVDRFIGSIHPGDAALFYYSGHALQIAGENYLAPVDLAALNEVQARNRS